MRMFNLSALLLCIGLLSGCIGDDIIMDTVEENLRISASIDTLGVGDTYQFEAIYTNNVGQEESTNIDWSSSDENLLRIDAQGLATGIAQGSVSVTANVNLADKTVTDVFDLHIADNTVVAAPQNRNGALRTTSSYVLQGNFVLRPDGDDLVLSFDDSYRASSSLPGLYLYLTNNPQTTSGAYEIGKATSFSGSHTYTIPGGDATLEQYTHVLFFCKPFNVKVGDGAFEE
ncbi:MAG: DM13 domain-containing protein [Bacteroidota bacterium]